MYTKISAYQRQEFLEKCKYLFPEMNMYAHSFIERRIAYVMEQMNIVDWEQFMESMNDSEFPENFMAKFIVPATEFFRDSEVWKTLYHTILPKILMFDPCVIWIPDCTSGKELFSLLILLKIMGARKRVSVIVGCKSKHIIKNIQKASYPLHTEMILQSNFKATAIPFDIGDFYHKNVNSIVFQKHLLETVTFVESSSILSQNPPNVSFVLYRNTLLYVSLKNQHTFIAHIYKNMQYGGYLALGLKEGKSVFEIKTLFSLEYPDELIYRKK